MALVYVTYQCCNVYGTCVVFMGAVTQSTLSLQTMSNRSSVSDIRRILEEPQNTLGLIGVSEIVYTCTVK